jgi:hypothetical protein
MTETPAVVLERDCRLSQSMLWRVQRRYYSRQGIEAWSRSKVPHFITCNPAIARAYAEVVLGFLRDWQSALDPEQPVYIVELGAGAGRFAYLFLREFSALLGRSPLCGVRWTYVLTDFIEETIGYWQAHVQLQPFFAAGQLDVAGFDLADPRDLALRRAGITLVPAGRTPSLPGAAVTVPAANVAECGRGVLTARAVRNPLIVLGNYVFDSVPQDVFAVEAGQLHECLVTLTSPQPEPDPEDPAVLERIRVDYTRRPVAPDYYPDAEWNRILADYARHLDRTHFLFPGAALQCVRYFEELSGGRLLLLSGDKSYSREEEMADRGAPVLVVHGSFSLTVNFHAVGQYLRNRGGDFLLTDFRTLNLDVVAFLPGSAPGGYAETRLAYYESIGHHNPADLFMLKKGYEGHYDGLDLAQLIAWLRLSGWDAGIFRTMFSALLPKVAGAPVDLQEELYWGIRHIWANYYHIGERWDMPFSLAMMLCELERYPEALEYLQRSLALYGADAITYYNMSLCHYRLRQLPEAQQRLDEALALDATCEAARSLRIKIEAEEKRIGDGFTDAGGSAST